MFQIYDTRTGRVADVSSGPGGLLRLYARPPAPQRPLVLGELRTLLVADLIRRNAEHRHGLTVVASLVMPDAGNDGGAAGPGGAPDAAATALNIKPAEQTSGRPELTASAVGDVEPGEIVIEALPGPAARAAVQYSVRVAGAHGAPEVPLSALAGSGLDPLAARLALLSFRHAEQAALGWDVLAEADRALRRWREHVAEWAESPSKPMCAEVTAQVAAAFDDDLDTPAALRALRGLDNDPQIPPGSKFESFLHADQLLGLDLPRDIGRPRYGPGAAAPAAQ